ncbi:MAG: hypothetical protein QM278_06790 [Pseudomonadota bacterium]|nr:hypothetical protein [Pseudomonadota bacterium]
MKEKYGGRLALQIFTTDAPEAEPYRFRSSTNVLFEKELVPVDVATDVNKMAAFLAARM